MYGSWDIVHDRWMDGKSDIYRWVPHLKNFVYVNDSRDKDSKNNNDSW